MRYSDLELCEFKKNIELFLNKAEDEMLVLQLGDHPICSELNDDEYFLLLKRQRIYIDNLKAALDRIENKVYGICILTKNLIPKQRLLAVPHATLSINPNTNYESINN